MAKKNSSRRKNQRRKKKTARTTYKRKKKWSAPKKYVEIMGTVMLLSLALVLFFHGFPSGGGTDNVPEEPGMDLETKGVQVLPAVDGPAGRPEIIQDFIEKNPYSRSGERLEKVKGVVVHYVANPGSTAQENRDYFENLKDTHLTKASSHFIIGIDGEIIQCIPLEEISYASNHRNADTISIECCHKRKDGKFTKKTYRSLVRLTTWLCKSYGIKASKVIRHYDVTGKMCPKYYVKHEEKWKEFLDEVKKGLQ
ncbi:MAG: peptidoglycan recognition family protein [Eubacteriales bacterium]|nr:peptidoglycan recognition family protein [Eubacteriales bacterium]